MDPLTRTLLSSLDPLLDAAADPAGLRSLLAQIGVELPSTGLLEPGGPLGGLLDPLADLIGDIDALRSGLEDDDLDLDEALLLMASVPGLVGDVMAAARALEGAAGLLGAADVPAELRDPALWAAALDRLPGVLLAQALQQELPGVYLLLRAVGVVEVDSPAPAGELDLSVLPAAVADPGAALGGVLGWGRGTLDAEAVAELLFAVADAVGLPLRAGPVGVHGSPSSPMGYDLPLVSGQLPALGYVESGVVVEPVDGAAGAGSGLAVAPYARGAAPARADLVGGGFVELAGPDGDAARLVLEPGVAPRVEGPEPGLAVAVGTAFPTPVTVLGVGGLGVTASGFRLVGRWVDGAAEVEVDTSPGLTFGLTGSDGFLRVLLGEATSVTVDASLVWRHGAPLRFRAGGDLTLDLPLDVTLGPVTVERVQIVVEIGDPIGASLTASVGATLGPLAFGVEGIGLAAELTAVDGAPPCPAVRFVPPHRVGLTFTSEAVNGGGFLEIDPETGRYAGGLALDILGFGISAIVVVDTEVPGDPDGFALFASLGLTFPTPIPIGFGFTLVGVGGLLALDRTLDIDALAGGLRTGAADAILFPDDLLRDADAVLAGLDQWFPAQAATTTVGPVVEIGWGNPTLITAQLGVVVTLPDLIIALLGSVEILLPSPEAPLLTLRMDILGAVDLPASTVVVAASLHDSNLLGIFELSGDMGFYACLAEQPLFVLSVGGYHPQFDPPGALPSWLLDLRRTRAAVPLGDGVEVVLTSYVAVTSNTFQFGGRFHLEASVEVAFTTYTAEGWFGVNVLLVLKPFKIVARATAGVSISAGDKELLGVDLAARVEGPQPWYATGRASFTFFGFDVELSFDVGSQPGGEPREVHDVAADVVAALSTPTAWEAAAPADPWARGVVMADELPAGLWVRPDQVVELRQSIAPLNRTMTAYGELVPEVPLIAADGVTVAGAAVESPEWLDDWFAPAQFDRLDDTTRLSSPSYEMMTAGVRFGADGVGISDRPDDECTSVSRAPEESVFPDAPGHVVVSDHVSDARPAAGAAATRTVEGERIAVLPTTYTVVRTVDGARADAVVGSAGSALTYAGAVAVVAARPPHERARLKVAPAHAAGEEAT